MQRGQRRLLYLTLGLPVATFGGWLLRDLVEEWGHGGQGEEMLVRERARQILVAEAEQYRRAADGAPKNGGAERS